MAASHVSCRCFSATSEWDQALPCFLIATKGYSHYSKCPFHSGGFREIMSKMFDGKTNMNSPCSLQPLQWFWTWKNFHHVHAGRSVQSAKSSSWQRPLPLSALSPGWCVSWQLWWGIKPFLYPGEILMRKQITTCLACFYLCSWCYGCTFPGLLTFYFVPLPSFAAAWLAVASFPSASIGANLPYTNVPTVEHQSELLNNSEREAAGENGDVMFQRYRGYLTECQWLRMFVSLNIQVQWLWFNGAHVRRNMQWWGD